MNYSNGFDLDRVLPVLMGRRAWVQPTVPTFTPVLDADNTTAASGTYYNYEHSACSPVKIWEAQEDYNISDADFNTFLDNLRKQVAIESVLATFPQPEIIEPPKILFEKQFRTSYIPIQNSSKFCGWQIKISEGDYATKIESIGLTMSTSCDITLYLFNDLKQLPIWEQQFSIAQPNNQTIFNIDDLVISRLNDEHKGGIFFFGYFQDEIAAQSAEAVDVYLNWWQKYYMVGYQSMEAVSNWGDLTFVRDQYFSNFRTYGLNVEMSTFRDHTNTIIRNAYAWDKLQGLMMTVKCLELQMNSSRVNGGERLSRDVYEMLYNEVEGLKGGGEGVPYRQGLKDKIRNEVKRLQRTFFNNTEIETLVPPSTNNYFRNNPRWGNQV